MTDTSHKWVTVARFYNAMDALFFKNVLEGHGIPAFVRNEHLGQLMAHLTFGGATGGIQLQVPSDCAEAAHDILTPLQEEDASMEEDSDATAFEEELPDDDFEATPP